MNNRVNWIDIAKAICIFFVVLGHTHINLSLKSFIYVFHIPCFFFLSGITFSFDKNPRYFPFLRKKLFQLIIPYLFFNIVCYVFWYFIGRKVGADIEIGQYPEKQLFGILLGNDANHYLEHCAPLWFLTCLFVVENLFYLIFRRFGLYFNCFLLIAFFVLGYIDYQFNSIRFPWGLNVALTTIVFFGLGVLFRNKWSGIIRLSSKGFALFVSSFFIILLVSIINGKIEVSIGYYGNYFLFFVGAISGIYFITHLSILISDTKWFKDPFLFFGRNTIIILGFHVLIGTFIKGFSYYVCHYSLEVFDNFFVALLYAFLTMLIAVPIIILLNKYFPFFIGRPNKKIITS